MNISSTSQPKLIDDEQAQLPDMPVSAELPAELPDDDAASKWSAENQGSRPPQHLR